MVPDSRAKSYQDIWKRSGPGLSGAGLKTGRDVLRQLRNEVDAAGAPISIFAMGRESIRFGEAVEVIATPGDLPLVSLDIAHQFFGQYPDASIIHCSFSNSFENNMIQSNFNASPDTPIFVPLTAPIDAPNTSAPSIRQVAIHSITQFVALLEILRGTKTKQVVIFEAMSAIFLLDKSFDSNYQNPTILNLLAGLSRNPNLIVMWISQGFLRESPYFGGALWKSIMPRVIEYMP